MQLLIRCSYGCLQSGCGGLPTYGCARAQLQVPAGQTRSGAMASSSCQGLCNWLGFRCSGLGASCSGCAAVGACGPNFPQ
jgi:hypothetical protein